MLPNDVQPEQFQCKLYAEKISYTGKLQVMFSEQLT